MGSTLKEALLIINPISGTRSKEGLDKLVTHRLHQVGIKVFTEVTKGAGDATRLARQAVENGMPMVISAGGDGTLNEIAGAISHTDVALGILPLGSGNGLARTLGIPQDIGEALSIIEKGRILCCDRGIVNDFPF